MQIHQKLPTACRNQRLKFQLTEKMKLHVWTLFFPFFLNNSNVVFLSLRYSMFCLSFFFFLCSPPICQSQRMDTGCQWGKKWASLYFLQVSHSKQENNGPFSEPIEQNVHSQFPTGMLQVTGFRKHWGEVTVNQVSCPKA